MVSKKSRLQGYCTTASIFFFPKNSVYMGEFSFLLYFLCWICNLQPDSTPHKCQWINFLVPQCRELAPLLVYSCGCMPLTSLPWASFGRSHGKEARDCRRRQESAGLFLAQSWVSFVAWGNFVAFLHISEPWSPHLKKGVGGHKVLWAQDTLIPKSGEFLRCHGTSWELIQLRAEPADSAESWTSWFLETGSFLSLSLLCPWI